MSESDVELFVELLANVMNRRGKNRRGGGGNYLPGTFDLKSVIFSLRCLLTHVSNQKKFMVRFGPEVNALLINALARYSLEPSTSPMDMASAEHIVFSLYLLSNHGFEDVAFLPEMYGRHCGGNRDHHHYGSESLVTEDEDQGLAANILVSYLRLSDIQPAGRHAAQQVLLRLEYLKFENNNSNMVRFF